MKNSLSFAIILLLFYAACQSTNATPPNKTLRILILGNSITHHGPSAAVGWSGDWGMAASSAETDFVHVLKAKLTKQYPSITLDYRERNIADWERDFATDFKKDNVTNELLQFKPDLLIIRLGENVKEDYALKNNYAAALKKLIGDFSTVKTHVIITGNFWPNAKKDSIQTKVAIDNGYEFVSLSDLAADGKNQATGLFPDGGVAAHPSDFGMNNIAIKIFDRIVKKKWY
ncbi:MAG: SGNH/GDSL hydrolase family protein [Bacteroidetes bacterium]|nr:SGNH/GDSL hydrolase family protein [Bacteroidota bacterium]